MLICDVQIPLQQEEGRPSSVELKTILYEVF